MNIVLTGGGTAGHVMPNIALLPYLRHNFDNVYYIGSESGTECEICKKHRIPFYGIQTVKLDRSNTFSNLKIPFVMHKCVKQAKKLLEELKPDVVFSKGGYVSLPVCLAAKKLDIPVVTHESDYSLGLANKIIAGFAKKVITSYPATQAKNAVFIGNPIRDELFTATGNGIREKFSLSQDKPILLVVGGSSGALFINELIYGCLDELLRKFDVIHVTGKNSKNIKKKGYYSLPYTDDIFELYAASSVIVSRCGANAAREITSLGKRVIFIPLPKTASRGDQLKNAKSYASAGLARVLEQEGLTSSSLLITLNEIMQKPAPEPVCDKTVNKKIADLITSEAKKADKNGK